MPGMWPIVQEPNHQIPTIEDRRLGWPAELSQQIFL